MKESYMPWRRYEFSRKQRIDRIVARVLFLGLVVAVVWILKRTVEAWSAGEVVQFLH
jgi:hypothetical protein